MASKSSETPYRAARQYTLPNANIPVAENAFDAPANTPNEDAMGSSTSKQALNGNDADVQKDKNGFFSLPIEIRQKIYRILFKRPLRICPSNIRYCSKDKRTDTFMNRLEYRYYWDGYRQAGGLDGLQDFSMLPMFNSFYHTLWLTMPSQDQWMVILDALSRFNSIKDIQLPIVYDEEREIWVEQKIIHRRGTHSFQIVNHAKVYTTPIAGIHFLRTCQTIADEACSILYGENKYSFDSTHCILHDWRDGANNHDALDDLTHESIPGLKGEDGSRVLTESDLDRAIERMFEHDPSLQNLPNFIYNDPFTRFCNCIGSQNSSLITDIKLDGQFKTVSAAPGLTGRAEAISFARLLPIYATILSRAFQGLRNVTIHVPKQRISWKEGLFGAHYLDTPTVGPPDDAKLIAEAVKRFVDAVPNMQHLQVGHMCSVGPEMTWKGVGPEWRLALRYMKVVEDRYNERIQKELLGGNGKK